MNWKKIEDERPLKELGEILVYPGNTFDFEIAEWSGNAWVLLGSNKCNDRLKGFTHYCEITEPGEEE